MPRTETVPAARRLISATLLLALPGLSGCDLLALGPFMPGLVPGVGFPLQGQVRDSRTFLPVGGATVTSGLGSTVTDAEGRFQLYGAMSSHEISVSRAGYVSKSLGGQAWSTSQSMVFDLAPLFVSDDPQPSGFLDLRGQLVTPTGVVASSDGLVFFAGKHAAVSNGAYQVQVQSQTPGKLFTTVMAGGRINGHYEDSVKAFQPFSFATFGYQLNSLYVGDDFPQGQREVNLLIPSNPPFPFRTVKVNYSNLAGFNNVQTTVMLDFGVAGTVPVACSTGSNQEISVPRIDGIKYVITGNATNDAKMQSSTVTITTTDPGQAPFQLLTPPKVLAPAANATNAGARPTFSWTPSNVPGVTYQVDLYEGDANSSATTRKWSATTSENEITYPGFAPNDVNGGALRPEKKYSWSLRVIDTLNAQEQPTSQRRTLALQPLRSRKREASTEGNTFTI